MVLLEFSIYPLGQGASLSPYVARCLEIVERSGLNYQFHAMGTLIEGEIEQVLDVVRQCFEALKPDCDRIACNLKFDYRRGAQNAMDAKVESVERRLGHTLRK
jgi:uncharacterized protein (TIGR00106 family)